MKDRRSDIQKRQQSELHLLLRQAQETVIGRSYAFSSITSYKQFSRSVPIHSYADIKADVQRMKEGIKDILWPGTVDCFAVSAGTSGEGKHLPFTQARRNSDRQFMRRVIWSYLKQRPNILRLAGSHLSIPGSVEEQGNFQIGEISGFTARSAPAILRMLQVADPAQLTTLSFRQKFDLLLNRAIESNLKVITAVPSWILTLFQETLKRTGKSSITEVWPDLSLLVCGGVKLANYRSHFEELTTGLSLDFIETYGASEGYIGFTDDLEQHDMIMVTDNGIFFECIPYPLPNTNASSIEETIPLWEVQTGVPYGLLMSTNAGLWRYTLNDIIEFTSLNPLRFEVKGRVNDMLDDFGEALYLYEAEQALAETMQALNRQVGAFTIAPVLRDKNSIPFHRWFIQFTEPVHPDTLKKIAAGIDKGLQQINRHYTIRRETNALGMPEIRPVAQADINQWMEQNGKARAQGKMPKIMPQNTESLQH